MDQENKVNEENKREVLVTILLKSGRELQGKVNIHEYKRFSDFIDEDKSAHVKMYNAIETGQIKSARPKFVLLPKNSIDWYIPSDQK
ncbi:MAG: hypothetical protein HQK69_03350 [Desulfamplus sp.]|nr:hypothetical protein [Desulfamplus sp.]